MPDVLRPPFRIPVVLVPDMLRLAAEEVETGELGIVTTAALVLVSYREHMEGDQVAQEIEVTLYSGGPRADLLSIRGALMSGVEESFDRPQTDG